MLGDVDEDDWMIDSLPDLNAERNSLKVKYEDLSLDHFKSQHFKAAVSEVYYFQEGFYTYEDDGEFDSSEWIIIGRLNESLGDLYFCMRGDIEGTGNDDHCGHGRIFVDDSLAQVVQRKYY